MVQAGSGIAPQSVTEARRELRRARQELEEAHRKHEEAQRLLAEQLAAAESVSKKDLIETAEKEIETSETVKEIEGVLVEKQSNLMKILKNLQSGGMAGVIARSCVAPMDRVKILQQTSAAIKTGQGSEYAGLSIPRVTSKVIEKEGLGGLWRGNLTNCIRVFPHAATQFTAYDFFKSQLKDVVGDPNSFWGKVVCGGLAGATAVTVTHPMDLVRIRLQTQPELKGVGDSMRQIYRTGGLFGFYRGYTSAVLSLSPFIAVNFATFDIIKTAYFGDMSPAVIKKQNPFLNLAFGAASGLVAQTVCYPLDTVRRRMALAGTEYTGNVNAVKTILQAEGIGGFYKGMAANALKVAPNNAIRFFAFSFIKDHLLS